MPWLIPLISSIVGMGVCWFLGRLIYSRWPSTSAFEAGAKTIQIVNLFYGCLLWWGSLNYWIYSFIRFPIEHRRRFRSRPHAERTARTTRRLNRIAIYSLVFLLSLITAIWATSISKSIFWLLPGMIQFSVLNLVWVSITMLIGRTIFVVWNDVKDWTRIQRWRYWFIISWVGLNYCFFLGLSFASSIEIMTQWDTIPVVGWTIQWISAGCRGDVFSSAYGWGAVLVCGALAWMLKRWQSGTRFKRKFLRKCQLLEVNELPFDIAVQMADGGSIRQRVVGLDLAQELRATINRNRWQRQWRRIDKIYLITFLIASLFPVVLVWLMNGLLHNLSVAEARGLHTKIAWMICAPMAIINLIVMGIVDTFMTTNAFGRRPLNLWQWWARCFSGALGALLSYLLLLAPAFVAIGTMYGAHYPWLGLMGIVAYCCSVVVCLWMICASIVAVVHLRCLLPRWCLWLGSETGQLLLLVSFIALSLATMALCTVLRHDIPIVFVRCAMAIPLLTAGLSMVGAQMILKKCE